MLSFYSLEVCYTPQHFKTPLRPLTPTLAVLCGIHLIFSLGWEAHVLFIVWQSLGFVFYLSYGMYHTPEVGAPVVKEEELTIQQLEREDVNLMTDNGLKSDQPSL